MLIPVFPLGHPVLPFTAIPLHVFEDRYREMMDDLMASDRTLGFVMIERGSEVGGGESRVDIGTLGRVARAERLDDGRWVLIAAGIARMRVTDWLPDDPYPRAHVEVLPAGDGMSGPAPEFQSSVRRIAALTAELGDPGPPIDVELSPDPEAAAYQALASAPVGPLDTQRVLEVDNPAERIEMVRTLLAEAEDLLRLRIAGG